MANFDLYETEELIADETFETNDNTSKISAKTIKRKWREIENYKENQRLQRELSEYHQYNF